MRFQTLQLLRMLCNPKITATPVRVLKELRKQGKRRLPDDVLDNLDKNSFSQFNSLRFIRKWLQGEQFSRHDGQWVLNSFLPPFPGPAYNRMFENLLSGRRLSPVSGYFAITATCPFNCKHCSIKNRQAGELTLEQWQNAISQTIDLGVSLIGFTGGEPLTRPDDLVEMVKTATEKGAATILYTTGIGLTDELAAALKQAGLWAVSISLDHIDKARFNEFRGADNAYDTAINAIKQVKKSGFYTMVGSVATPDYVDEKRYRQIYDFIKPLGVDEYRIVEPMPCGKLTACKSDALLTEQHIREIRNFHVETNRRGKLPKVCAFNQVESPEYFGCGGGTQHFYIDPVGNVCPCDFTPLGFGSVANDSFKSIWDCMTEAMGNPRRHCFIQTHHKLIGEYADRHQAPYSPEISKEICKRAGFEPLPDYFAMVCGTTDLNEDKSES